VAPDLSPPVPELDLLELMQAVETVISGILHPVLHSVVARPLDLEGAVLRIETLLANRSEITWAEAVGPHPTIVSLLSTLLAILELARRGMLRVTQGRPFTPPVIRRDTTHSTD
jgi:segregation and condensation protein A